MTAKRINTEEYRVKGEGLLAKVRELVHQGNIRRIIIQNDDGQTIVEIPLTLGVVGAILVPIWVAIGAIAALAADYRIQVHRADEKAPEKNEPAHAEDFVTAGGTKGEPQGPIG